MKNNIKLKYNQVVLINIEGIPYLPAARIIKVLDDDYYMTLCVNGFLEEHHISRLKYDPPYKGFWQTQKRFIQMPSMRKLKQNYASRDKSIWKRFRKRIDKNIIFM